MQTIYKEHGKIYPWSLKEMIIIFGEQENTDPTPSPLGEPLLYLCVRYSFCRTLIDLAKYIFYTSFSGLSTNTAIADSLLVQTKSKSNYYTLPAVVLYQTVSLKESILRIRLYSYIATHMSFFTFLYQ